MTDYYADTSALIKRHIAETGSTWLTTLASENLLLTSRLTQVEVYSALNRRVREKKLTVADYQQILADFEALCTTEYQLIEVIPAVITRARQLLEQHPLRAYDAVHLATALLTNELLITAANPPLTFLCADERLLTAAAAEGLDVANPNRHS